MLFDKMVKCFDQIKKTMGFPDDVIEVTDNIFRSASLFSLNILEDKEVVIEPEMFSYLKNDLIFPFNITAVETNRCCIIYSTRENAVGLNNELSCIVFYKLDSGYSLGYLILSTPLNDPTTLLNMEFENNIMVFDRNFNPESEIVYNTVEFEQYKIAIESSILVGLKELANIANIRNYFIFEEGPKKPPHSNVIPRSHQRSIFTLLTPKEIHKKLQSKSDTVNSLNEGHFRRRHYRELRNEKFKKNEDGTNKKIIIDAQWVGPESLETKNKIYKVRLDL